MYAYHYTQYGTPHYEHIAVRNMFAAYICLCIFLFVYRDIVILFNMTMWTSILNDTWLKQFSLLICHLEIPVIQ